MNRTNKLTKNYLPTQIFYIAYSCYLSCSAFIVNVWPDLSDIIKVLSLLMLMIAILFINMDFVSLIKVVALVLVGAFYFIRLGNLQIFILILFCVTSKDINLKQLVKIDFLVRSVCIILTNVGCLVGFIEDVTVVRVDVASKLIRHSLGYSHPNTAFLMVFVAIIDFLVICYLNKKFNIVKIVIALTVAFFYQYMTDSRSGFLCLILFIALLLLEKRLRITKVKAVKLVIIWMPLILLVVSVCLVQMYSTGVNWVIRLNEILSGRIKSAKYFLDTYGVNLFGVSTERLSSIDAIQGGERAYILDNLFFNLIISYGLIFTTLFIVMYYSTVKRMLKNNNEIYVIVLSIFAILGLVEGAFLNIDFNFYIFSFSATIYSKYFYERSLRITRSKGIKSRC